MIALARGFCSRIADEPHEPSAWQNLVKIGGEARVFAGAVRGVAEVLLGLAWEQIEAHAATLDVEA